MGWGGLQAVGLGEVGVAGGELRREVEDDLALLVGRVVLHLAVDEHQRTRPVAHCLDHALGVGDVGRVGAEHLLGDVDLNGVQAPGTDATEQVGVAELVLAGDDVLDVAEGPVVREDPGHRAGVDHAGDGVVPQVLLGGDATLVVEDAGLDPDVGSNGTGIIFGETMEEVLRNAAAMPGGLTRTNIMAASYNLDFDHPFLLDGIRMETSGTSDAYAIEGAYMQEYQAPEEGGVGSYTIISDLITVEGETGSFGS